MQFSMQHGSFGKLGKVAVGVAALVAIVGSIATHKVSAHHAFGAEFDPNRPLILRGPVTKVEWVNPHAWIHLEHTTEEGEKEIWMVEGGTPNTLLRRGLNKRSLTQGPTLLWTAISPRIVPREQTVVMSPWRMGARSSWAPLEPVLRVMGGSTERPTLSSKNEKAG